tara:strand:- start:2618 stop:2920 length:303 start_codon:yes stop_codon:yes gene_type:complete
VIKMSWEKILKEETDVPYELQMDDADESREKALDTLENILGVIEKWQTQHYSPYKGEKRTNPGFKPAKYGSESGELEREETHGLMFRIKNMIHEHIVNNR